MALLKYLDEAPLKRFHIIILIVAFLAYMLTATNVMLISGIAKRICDVFKLSTYELGILFSVGFIGMLIGALLFGRLADIIGRKWALIVAVLIHALFTALCGTATDYYQLMIYRFIAGVGLGGSLPIPGVYISEYIPAKYRGTFVGLVETAWVWGAIISLFIPLIYLPILDWRGVFYWGLLALIVVPLAIIFLPESIRYLEEKGKTDKAINILKKHGIIAGEVSVKPIEIKRISWKDLFRGNYLQRTFLLMSLWFILVYTYYGVFLWLPRILAEKFTLIGSILWAMIITLAQIPGYYSAAFLLDRIGRKMVLGVYLILAAIGSIIVAFGDFFEVAIITVFGQPMGLILFAGFLMISFFNLGAWSGLYTYTPELYPTEYRGTGSGIAAASGRAAGILAPYVTGYLLIGGSLIPAYTVFFLAHLIGGLLVFWMGIETKGLTLEEISEK